MSQKPGPVNYALGLRTEQVVLGGGGHHAFEPSDSHWSGSCAWLAFLKGFLVPEFVLSELVDQKAPVAITLWIRPPPA